MKPEITILDENKEVVGVTFLRRAKQMVSKNRAMWQDDTQTVICLIPTKNEEELQMDNEVVAMLHIEEIEKAQQNEEVLQNEERSELLIHLAERNILYKKGTVRQILLFPITFLLVIFLVDNRTISLNFYFVIGIFFAWGMYIANRTRIVVTPVLKAFFRSLRRNKKPKDPVELEYQRLKALNEEQLAVECKKYQ